MPYNREGEVIFSRQNRRIVSLCKLSDRKEREATGTFRFDGVKLLCEAIRREVLLDALYLRASSVDHVFDRMEALYGCTADDLDCPVFKVEDALFEKISEENAPEGVITVAKYIDRFHKMYIIKNEGLPVLPERPVLMLESVRDPSNVGAIIRSAAALGVGHMIFSRDCADLYNHKTIRAAMGALFSMPVTRVDDFPATVVALRASGRRVFSAAPDENAARIGEVAFLPTDCVVVGNEGHGLSPETVAASTSSIFIPMTEGTESLNASVAAALFAWELCR